MWQESLALFLEDLEPATPNDENTVQYSTEEIYQMLFDHTGDDQLTAANLTETLRQRGFTSAKTGPLKLEWVMRCKKTV